MEVGDGGYTGDSDAAGPTAGYDPVMKRVKRNKKKRVGVNEGKKPLPDFKAILRASDLEMRAEKEQDREKKMQLIDKAREVRAGV